MRYIKCDFKYLVQRIVSIDKGNNTYIVEGRWGGDMD